MKSVQEMKSMKLYTKWKCNDATITNVMKSVSVIGTHNEIGTWNGSLSVVIGFVLSQIILLL